VAYTETDLADGAHTFDAYTQDLAGNVVGDVGNVTFVTDTGYPTINFTTLTPGNATSFGEDSIFVNMTTNDTYDTYAFVDFDSDLLGWWRFDSLNSSGDPLDFSSYSNNGTAIADAAQTDAGKFGKGFSFDGTGDIINLGQPASLNFSGRPNFTISLWAYPLTLGPSERGFLARGSNSAGNRELNFEWHVGGEDLVFTIYNDTSSQVFWTVSNTFPLSAANQWHHIAVVINSTHVQYYVGGVANGAAQAITISGLYAPDRDWEIGRAIWGTSYGWNGTLDEFMIWNRSLGAEEISALYNASANQYYHNFTELADQEHNFKGYVVDEAGNVNSTFLRRIGAVAAPAGSRFKITNSTNSVVASVDNKGDMYLLGTYSESQGALGLPSKSFMIQNSGGTVVSYFNNSGSLFLTGAVTQFSDLSGLASSNLEIRNSTEDIVAFFDNAGNLKLQGGIVENYGNP
jgi:hypothetical protein